MLARPLQAALEGVCMMIRQGDLLLVSVQTAPVHAQESRVREHGRLVLAYGEVTGHAHAIREPGADLYDMAPGEVERRFLRVLAEGGVTLSHEEHGMVTVPVGDYVVQYQRQYVPKDVPRPRYYAD